MAKNKTLTVSEAAKYLGVTPTTLRRWDDSGKLKAKRLGKRGDRMYKKEILERFKEIVELDTDDASIARKRIEKIFLEIENISETAKYLHTITQTFKKARDYANWILDKQKDSDNYQALMDVFSFQIIEDNLKPKMSGTDAKGKVWSYPNSNDLTNTNKIYLKKMFLKFEHPRLRSRIAHVLWFVDNDFEYAKKAVDEYLILAPWLIAKVENNKESHHGHEAVVAIINSQIIARKIKYKLADVNKLLAKTVFNFSEESRSRNAVAKQLLEFAYKNKNDFNKDFWENAVGLCKSLAAKLEAEGNTFFAREFWIFGQKVESSILGSQKNNLQEKVAISLEQEAEKHKENFLESDFLMKAIKEYRNLGDRKKVEELSNKLKSSKANMKFETFETSLDISKWAEGVQKTLKKIVERENEEQLLIRLAADQSIIPKHIDVEKAAEKIDKQFPLQSLFSHSIIDQEGNVPKKYETEAERKYLSLLRQYKFSLTTYQVLINIIMHEAVVGKKLKLKSVETFMASHLWYGKKYVIKDEDTGEILSKSRRWIKVLSPGIKSYVDALNLIEKGNNKLARDKIILAIDSLTPKIEGIVREFFNLQGKITDKTKTIRGNKEISEKKNLNDMLREPSAEELLGRDLTLLMKYVLIEHVGYNLKNNTSHSLFYRENYILIHAHLIFIILLRIGAFKIKQS